MAVKILHKRSAVQFKSATGAQLEFGELGLNYHESGPYLQCKDAAGEIIQLGGVYIGTTAPGNELKGAWWLRDSDNTLFLYDGSSWVSIAGGGGGGGTTTVVGADGIDATTVGTTVTVKVDLATPSHGLSIVGGKLQADIATKSSLGTVSIGSGLEVDSAGEISVDVSGLDVNADLGYTPAVDKGTVTNTAGNDATLPLADGTNAGLFTAAEKQQLADLVAEDPKNQDLSYKPDGQNAGTVEITDGTDAVIPIATSAQAGLFTGTEKDKLAGIEAGAEKNTVDSITGGDGITATDSSGAVTVAADLDTAKGLEIVSSKVAVKVGAGLAFDSDGKIENTVTGGLVYKGTVDVTSTTIPSAVQNDLYANIGDGNFSSDWAAVTSNAETTDTAQIGEWMIYTGTEWNWIPLATNGILETDADKKYLRVDSAAGDQVRLKGKATFREGIGVENTVGKETVISTDLDGSLRIDSPAELDEGGSVRIAVAPDKTSVLSFEGSRIGQSGWTAGEIAAFSGYGSATFSWMRFALSNLAFGAIENYAYLRSRAVADGNYVFGTAEKLDFAVGFNGSGDLSGIETAAPIYLASDGTARFSDVTTHEAGVSVTGGPASTSNFIGLYLNSNGSLCLQPDPNNPRTITFVIQGKSAAGVNSLGHIYSNLGNKPPQDSLFGFDASGQVGPGGATDSITGFRSDGSVTNAFGDTGVPRTLYGYGYYATNSYGRSSASDAGRSANRLLEYSGFAVKEVENGAATTYGFLSDIDTSSATTQYNFYAAGTAPNYFAGRVGIGAADPKTTLDVNGDITIQGVKNAASLATDANGKVIAGSTFTENDANGLYLSKVNDDTADGAITFKKLTTHEAGVKVTGGTAANVTDGLIHTAEGLVIVEDSSEQVVIGSAANLINIYGTCTDRALRVNTKLTGDRAFQGIRITNSIQNTAANYSGLYIEKPTGPGTVSGEVSGVYIRADFTNVGSTTYGVQSQVDAGSGNNYNFYAKGTAPNYFAGVTQHANGLQSTGNDSVFRPATNENASIVMGHNSSISPKIVIKRGGEDTIDENCFEVRVTSDTNPIVKFNYSGQAYFNGGVFTGRDADNFGSSTGRFAGLTGDINPLFKWNTTVSSARDVLTAANTYGNVFRIGTESNTAVVEAQGTATLILRNADGSAPLLLATGSDDRLVSTTAAITNASSIVQQLQPVKINDTHHGFVASALQPLFAEAVNGTAGATEPIGTLVDWDGTELETEVLEPEAEELTYTEEVEINGVTQTVTRTRSWSETGTRDIYQGVDQTKLIPLLTKALQEALERIEALEAAQP